MKAVIKVLRFAKDIYPEVRRRICNFLLALLQTEERCWSKLSSESIMIPSKISVVFVVSDTSPIDPLIRLLCLGVNGS